MLTNETTFVYLIGGELALGNIAKYSRDVEQGHYHDVPVSMILWAPSPAFADQLASYDVNVRFTHTDSEDFMHHVIEVTDKLGHVFLTENMTVDGRN